ATLRLVAAVDFERTASDHGGERVRIVELPRVDEAVVARRAFHVDAEEDLRDVLRELQLRHLAGVDVAAPLDAADETLSISRRADQLAYELVVGLVVIDGAVEPGRDLL